MRARRMAQAQARVAELEAALRVARLPARGDERCAAAAQAEAARQALRQSQWREQQKQQVRRQATRWWPTPTSGSANTCRAGQPVVALLPPAQVKARFFVPEAAARRAGAPARR